MKKLTVFKLIIILLLVAGLIYLWTKVDIRALADQERIQALVEENFFKGALYYIIAYAAIKFTLIPFVPLASVGGYVFGTFWGTVFASIGFTIASTTMFLLTRLLGEEYVRKFMEDKFKRLAGYNKHLKKHGLLTVIFLRIIPVAPLVVVNVGLGLSRIKIRDFLLGTIIGVIPGNIFFASIGYRITDYTSPVFIALVSGFILFTAMTTYIAYRLNHKKKRGLHIS